jgi:hypothetical protein
MLNLVKWGYGFKKDIIKEPLHDLLSAFNWFKKESEKEDERERDRLKHMTCPLLGGSKNKSMRKIR